MQRLAPPPRIYNLYPRLAGDLTSWPAHARRAGAMGFDWFYVNPLHYPGFSGSIYAVKDYYRLDPCLLPPSHADHHYEAATRADGGMELLRETLAEVSALGQQPMMDLVINHTARDAELVDAHPLWYARQADGTVQSPSAIDPADARRVTVWGDLAEIDHAGSPDRAGLWAYLEDLVRHYARLGFVGFRCDAAYHVPAELWTRLIGAARAEQPGATFFAETLGARLPQIDALRPAGLHFIFNSSKWWDFESPWCIDQQHAHAALAPSVSFPESHDTPRLWAETGGSAALQRQRYAFAAAFSSAVMMPVGYEFGFMRKLDVVQTRPEHWEAPSIDLGTFVARVNGMKVDHPALAGEEVEICTAVPAAVLLLEKRHGDSVGWVTVNKDASAGQSIDLTGHPVPRGARLLRPCLTDSPDEGTAPATLHLEPAEVAYLLPA